VEEGAPFPAAELVSGWHDPERDVRGPFRWSAGRFALRLRQPGRFLRLHLTYEGPRGRLSLGQATSLDLGHGPFTYVADLGGDPGALVHGVVDPPVRVPGDPRELGVMLRGLEPFDDADRFRRLAARQANAARNAEELRRGAVALGSTPPYLRMSLERGCSIVPRCVYCEWDHFKAEEARSDLRYDSRTLRELGPFLDNAEELVDCGVGEPFLNRDLPAMLEELERGGKHVELTTHGQHLDARRRSWLLGRDVTVYVSLDAATAASYARYRNDGFDALVDNVRALCRERERHGGRPVVVLSFIVMRSNVDEFGALLDLARDLGVDLVKARSLYEEGTRHLPEAVGRAGHVFRYADERLDVEETRRFCERARALAREKGVRVYLDFEEFERPAGGADGPLCTEPWRTMYVLNRGVMPCCFGKEPLARVNGNPPGGLGALLAEVFDGPAYRELRAGLAERRLPRYCEASVSCPIVRKVQAHQAMPHTDR
jgi:MoaA/NifB/PqqE/SkfB family radical SAM enzyme